MNIKELTYDERSLCLEIDCTKANKEDVFEFIKGDSGVDKNAIYFEGACIHLTQLIFIHPEVRGYFIKVRDKRVGNVMFYEGEDSFAVTYLVDILHDMGVRYRATLSV